MANKLTKEKLNLLIEQVLNEASSSNDIKMALAFYDSSISQGDEAKEAYMKTITQLRNSLGLGISKSKKIIDDALASRDSGGKSDPYKEDGEETKPDPKPPKKSGIPANPLGLKKKDATVTSLSPSGAGDFSYDLTSIPPDLKSIILRLFKDKMESSAELKTVIKTDDDVFKALSAVSEGVIKEDAAKLEWEDFATILKNPDSEYFDAAVLTIRQAANISPDANWTKGLKDVAKKLKLTVGTKGAGDEELIPSTPSMDIADIYGGERKSVPNYVVDFFNNLDLGGATTVVERIKKINDTTKAIMGGNTDENMPLGELMSNIAVQSTMARIAKLMDNKAAGWAFESFLAQLANGSGEGASMGAGDFSFGIGAYGSIGTGKGSAKLVESYVVTQSKTTTKAAIPGIGDKMVYIVGRKMKDITLTGKQYSAGQVGSQDVGTATPSEIKRIAVFMFVVKRTTLGKNAESYKAYTVNDATNVVVDNHSDKDLSYNFNGTKPIGIIELAVNLKDMDKKASVALTKVNEFVPKLIKQTEVFKRRTNSYLSGGDINDLNEATKSYSYMFALINSAFSHTSATKQSGVVGGVEQDADASTGVKAKTATAVSENQTKSLKDLDKLIERVILNKMLIK